MIVVSLYWQHVTVSLSVSTASLEGPRFAGSFATTSLQASEASVTCGAFVTWEGGSEDLEGCGTSVPTSCKVLVNEEKGTETWTSGSPSSEGHAPQRLRRKSPSSGPLVRDAELPRAIP